MLFNTMSFMAQNYPPASSFFSAAFWQESIPDTTNKFTALTITSLKKDKCREKTAQITPLKRCVVAHTKVKSVHL